jgi:hypothetical protein
LQDIVVKLCLEKPTNPLKFLRGFLGELEAKAHVTQEEEEEEQVEVQVAAPKGVGGSRRGGVSADVIDNHDAMAYEKKVNHLFSCSFAFPLTLVVQGCPKGCFDHDFASTLCCRQRAVRSPRA